MLSKFIRILLLLIITPLQASMFDQGHLFFDVVGKGEKIVSGAITALIQDKRGFIWIGTQHGLVRYDGYKFIHFSANSESKHKLTGDFITSLWSDNDGRIWIGTRANGFSVLDPTTNIIDNYKHDTDEYNSLADNRVSAIIGDNQGNIWLGTNNGLDLFNEKDKSFVHFRHNAQKKESLNDDHIRSLYMDKAGDLWIGSYDGLNIIRQGSKKIERIYSDDTANDSLAGHVIFRILQGKDDAMWVSTPRKGAIRIDSTDGKFTRIAPTSESNFKISNPWVTTIAQPKTDEIWLGTNGGGIAVVHATSGEVKRTITHHQGLHGGLLHNDIGSMIIDNSGLLWIGTWGAGMNRYNPLNNAFRTLRSVIGETSQLSSPHILSILQSKDGKVWIGSQGKGIDVFDPEIGKIKSYAVNKKKNSLEESNIQGLAQMTDGSIWVGTLQTGLYRYLPETDNFKRFTVSDGLSSNQIRRLKSSNDNSLWVGTFQELSKWDDNNKRFLSYTFANENNKPILAISETKDGHLWIGTPDGLYELPAGNASQQEVHKVESFGDIQVNDLLLDSFETLWLSTPQGLFRQDLNNEDTQFKSINDSLGIGKMDLGSNLFIDDHQRIWTATHLIDLKTHTVHRWSSADGVDFGVPWDGSHYILNEDVFAIGGTDGVLLIKPKLYQPWTFLPSLEPTELTIDKQVVRISNDSLVLLPADSKSFTIKFSSLDYSKPEGNQYTYKLEGYDENWIKTTSDQRSATYTNLDPKTYIFHVKATNRNGLWSPNEINLKLKQLPLWYQTSVFKFIFMIAVISLLYFVYLIRVRHLKRTKLELKKMVKKQTIELDLALKVMKEASFTDHLTQLGNRRFLTDHINADLLLASRAYFDKAETENSDLVFFIFDIDYFKAVNDKYGHLSGDKVLVQFSNLLKDIFRDSDMFIRWGGEEFLVISRFCNRNTSCMLAERARQQIADFKFDIGGGRTINKTCSIGYAAYPFIKSKPDKLGWEQLINIADIALFAAKRSQRNAWVGLSVKKDMTRTEIELLFNNTKSLIGEVINVESSIENIDEIIWNE